MDLLYKDLFQGEVDLHDSWQLELETICPATHSNSIITHTQEFYFFIPSALQITQENYLKEHFYNDRTHFVRQKTSTCTFEELSYNDDWVALAYKNKFSIFSASGRIKEGTADSEIKEYLFLSANIYRSSLRKNIKIVLNTLKNSGFVNRNFFKERLDVKSDSTSQVDGCNDVEKAISQLCCYIKRAVDKWRMTLQNEFVPISKNSSFVNEAIICADQYISTSIEFYLSSLLLYIRPFSLLGCEKHVKDILFHEKDYRITKYNEAPSFSYSNDMHKENALCERNWNEKLIRSVLFLTLRKHSFSQRWGHIIASFAAGLAAFLYLLILFWKSTFLVVNSMNFIIASSILYIFKDRIKEVVKSVFQQQACRFFDDFRTDIYVSERSFLPFGRIKEYFMMLRPRSIPPDIQELALLNSSRKQQLVQGQETVLYYRKKINLKRESDILTKTGDKPVSLHTIFRYSIRRLLEKASDPCEEIICYDEIDQEVKPIAFPKVYYINLIVKTVAQGEKGRIPLYHKYRIVADSRGIKRIERRYEGSLDFL